jgi:carboxyl-terminal processing protease
LTLRRRGFAAGMLAGVVAGLAAAVLLNGLAGPFGEDRSLADEARQEIEDNYFQSVGGDTLNDASVEGMIRDLHQRYDDRFSHYLNPRALTEFESSTSGQFSGVGLTVSSTKEGLRVVSVLPDTPADHAGLRQGDVITAVDGHSIAGEPSEVSTARIKGPPGTSVTLRVTEAGSGDTRNVSVDRAAVEIPAVRGELEHAGGQRIGYLRYASFSSGSHGELRKQVERLYGKGAKGLVLDMRGNPGGLLNEAVLSASVFVKDGLIVSTDSRTQGHRNYDATGDALAPRPIVVLIDHNTASAAEILTSALADHHLATVVGTRSFGKGTFQEVIHLDAGGALDLTIGRYFTADGISLAGKGIRPDVHAADVRATGADEALSRARAVLAGELGSR